MTDAEWFAANPNKRIRIKESSGGLLIVCRFSNTATISLLATAPTGRMVFVARGEEDAEDYEIYGDIEPSFAAKGATGREMFVHLGELLKELP